VSVVPPGGDATAGGLVATLGGIPVDRVLVLPAASSRRCTSRRRFVIHVHRPRSVRFRSVTVTVNGKRKVRLRGKRVRTTISLRGLPKGRVKVRILAVTTTGAKAASVRTYHTCSKTKAARHRRAARRAKR
jgi:hypothetical protein